MAVQKPHLRPIPKRATRDEEDQPEIGYEEQPIARVSRIYHRPEQPQPKPPQEHGTKEVHTQPIPRARLLFLLFLWHLWLRLSLRSRTWLVSGMGLMLVLYLFGSLVVLPFGISVYTHWRGGEAHVLVYELNVGHKGTSTFLTQYYHGQAVVIEYPGGKMENPRMYIIAASSPDPNQPLITLSIQPGKQTGKPDVLVTIEGNPIIYRLVNTGERFAAPTFV